MVEALYFWVDHPSLGSSLHLLDESDDIEKAIGSKVKVMTKPRTAKKAEAPRRLLVELYLVLI